MAVIRGHTDIVELFIATESVDGLSQEIRGSYCNVLVQAAVKRNDQTLLSMAVERHQYSDDHSGASLQYLFRQLFLAKSEVLYQQLLQQGLLAEVMSESSDLRRMFDTACFISNWLVRPANLGGLFEYKRC